MTIYLEMNKVLGRYFTMGRSNYLVDAFHLVKNVLVTGIIPVIWLSIVLEKILVIIII